MLAGASLFSAAPSTRAATKYWEPTGTTGTNASGTWNTTSASWNTDSTGVATPLTTFGNSTFTGTYSSGTVSGTYSSTDATKAVLADDAVFSADPAITGVSTVSLGANIGANSITFGNAGVTNGGAAAGFTFASGNVLTIGTYTVSGANTYTGNTALTMNAGAGPVIFNNQVNLANNLPDAAGGSTLNYSIANNSSSLLTFNGQFQANTRPQNTNDTVNLTFSGTGGVTFNGAVVGNNASIASGGGNLNLIINGGGAVALNAANAANGSVALSNGSLTLGNSLAMQALALNQTGGTFSFGTLTAATIGGLTGTSNLTLSNAAGTAGVALSDAGFVQNGNTVAANPTFAGNINGLGSLTINGVEKSGNGTGGTATFSGQLSFTGAAGLTINDTPLAGSNTGGASSVVLTSANSYTGPTAVTLPGGTLTLNGNGTIAGTSAITLNSGLVAGSTTAGGTTLFYDNRVNGTANRLGTAPLTLNGSTLTYNAVTTGTNTAGTGSAGPITIGGAQNSSINFNGASGTGNTSNFTIASLAQTAHSTLTVAGGFLNGNVNFVTLTTAPTLINGILPWTYETTNQNFLSVNASNQLNAYNTVGTVATTFNNTATSNVQLNAAAAAPAAAVAENSLIVKFNGTQPLGGQALTLTSGGLIFTPPTGAAVLGSAANDGSLTTAAANPELYVNTAATGTINAAITNSGSTSVALTKFGTSTLTLAGTNTYTGVTTVEQGGLTIAATGSILNSATTLVGGASFTNSGTAGAVTANAGSTATLNGGSTTGAITDNGSLTIAGTTALTTGNISGTGGTGTITYTNTLAAGNTLTFGSGANSLATISDNQTAGPLTIAVSGSSTLALATLNGSNNSTVKFGGDGTGSTNITGGVNTTGQLLDVTAGTVTLNSERNVAENFQVDGGSLIFNNTRYSNNANTTFKINGGLVQFNANTTYGFRASSDNGFQGAGTAGLTFTGTQTGGTLSLLTNNAGQGLELGSTAGTDTTTYNLSGGLISGLQTSNGGTYIDLGADTAGTSTSTFNFSGGKILLSGAIEGGQGAGAKQAFVWTGGTLAAGTFDATKLTSTSGTAVVLNSTNTLTNAGTGILAPGDIGTVGLTTITGNYSVTSANAAYAVDLGTTAAATAFQNGTTGYDQTNVSLTAALGGKLRVGLVGGFLTTAPTAATNFTILQSGTGTKSVGSLSGTFTNTEVGKTLPVLALNGTGATGLNSFSVTYNAGTATANGSVVLGNYSATNTYTGATGSTWDAAAAANWSVFDPGSTATPATVASGAVAQFADNAGTGAGANAVTLNSTRNIQGISFSSGTAGHNYTINNGGAGAIILDNTANATVATINDTSAAGNANTISVPITLNSPLAVAVTNAANTLTVNGGISGAQMLTKNGAGTLVLGGTNTYTGSTNVSTGAMLVNGTVGSSATPAGLLTVNSTATLGGSGMLTVSSAIVNAGGTLAPGAAIGATTGALTLNTMTGLTINGGLNIGVTSGGVGTFLATNNLLTLGSGATLNITGTLDGVNNYDIANYGTLAGTFAGYTAPAGYTLNYAGTSFGPADIELDVTAVPEPSTWIGAMLAVVAGAVLRFRRKVRGA